MFKQFFEIAATHKAIRLLCSWMAGPLSRPVSNRNRYRIESVRFQSKRTDALIRARKTHA